MKMPASLRLRLLLTLLVVVGAALGTVAIYASRATTSEFERSVAVILTYRDPRLESKIHQIQKYVTRFSGDGSIWYGLQQLLESMGNSTSTRYVLAGLDGYIYADSQGHWIGQTLDTQLSKPFAAFLIEGKPVLAYFEPFNPSGPALVREKFVNSVNRSLLLASLAAGALALLLTLGLSRSILAPVSALTAAARRMQNGDEPAREARGAVSWASLRGFHAMADAQRMESCAEYGQRRRTAAHPAFEHPRLPGSAARWAAAPTQSDRLSARRSHAAQPAGG
jgi:two-component system OmpR family sensor kinase